MNLLAVMRRRHGVWIPRLAAPIAAVWLSMVWQPCAMAMDTGVQHEHRCAHCPPPKPEHCDDIVTHECDDGDQFRADLRTPKAKPGDGPTEFQAALVASNHPYWLPVPPVRPCLAHPPTAPPVQSLPILFCAFLN